jgi:hypothetical protein
MLKRTQDTAVAGKRPIATPTLDSELDRFLHAPIGEANNEVPLIALSALARRHFDPWDEAADLARMSTESVVVKLAAVIASATAGASANRDSAANAARLNALLPQASGFGISRYDPSPKRPASDLSTLVIYLIVGGLIIASALLGH